MKQSYYSCTEVTLACPVSATTYGYTPNLGGNVFFSSLFGLLLILSVILGFRTRTWTYTLASGLGLFGETAGYIGRDLMHYNPWSKVGFQTQIICLILAPSFLAACIYLSLKHFVTHYGPEHSWLRPRLYPWVFVGSDIGAICLQAIGGGMAAVAGKKGNHTLLNAANGLIVTGIAFQVVAMAVSGILILYFTLRYHKAKKLEVEQHGDSHSNGEKIDTKPTVSRTSPDLRKYIYAVGISYVAILIRCIYRLPEMAGGWGNPLMQNEHEFLVLDGGMVAVAGIFLTVFHPGYFFPAMRKGQW